MVEDSSEVDGDNASDEDGETYQPTGTYKDYYPQATDLMDTYTIDNAKLEEDMFKSDRDMSDNSLKVRLNDYCADSSDQFACNENGTIESAYFNLLFSQEKQSVLLIASEYAKDPTSGKELADWYLAEMKASPEDYKCHTDSGMLVNSDYTTFIYGIVLERFNKENHDLYTTLDNIKKRTEMEYLYRCDQM